MTDIESFGRYRLIKALGRGSTSTVWLASDGDSEVALKILHEQLSLDPIVKERFRRELEASRRVSHPNVARVYDLVSAGDRVAAVMEYCAGGSLADRGRVSCDEAERWLRSLAPALAAAHAAGLVHRDIKPENILFSVSGEPKLCDFGSASVRDLMGLTATTSYLSTPLYMPPEGADGAAADPRWDLYSLGAVFRRALTGKPHRGESFGDLFAALARPVPSLADELPDAPARLVALIDALLAPRDTRLRHAAAIIDCLDGLDAPESAVGKRCLFCGAPMPIELPYCPICRKGDLFPSGDPGPEAETLVLKKVCEDATAMKAFYSFVEAWSAKPQGELRFVTGDARMYSKEEKQGAVTLPWPLIANLDPATAIILADFLSAASGGSVHVERVDAQKAARKYRKKPPLLSTARPWPAPSDPGFFARNALVPRSPDSETGESLSLFDELLVEAYRIRSRSPDPEAKARVDRLLGEYRAVAQGLERIDKELDAIHPGTLYREAARVDALMENRGELPTAEYAELLERRRTIGESAKRREELEREHGKNVNSLLEAGATLRRMLAKLDSNLSDEELEAALEAFPSVAS